MKIPNYLLNYAHPAMPTLIEQHNAAATKLLHRVDPATPLYKALTALCDHNLNVIRANQKSG